jgi:hypothetical protein
VLQQPSTLNAPDPPSPIEISSCSHQKTFQETHPKFDGPLMPAILVSAIIIIWAVTISAVMI